MNILDFTCSAVEFGCGCNKSKLAAAANPAARRITIYEVMKDSQAVAEFTSLVEARTKAAELGGRVKVSSKVLS